MPTSERARLRQAQKDTQCSDWGGRPGRRVKANLCSLFLQTRRGAKLSTRTSWRGGCRRPYFIGEESWLGSQHRERTA